MQKELQFLEEQDISPTLLAQVEAFREEYPVDKAALQRVNRPNIPFYGKEILEMAMAALLQGSNLLLSGAKATGKNILAENLAWIFGRPSYNISFNVNTDSSTLIGTDTFRIIRWNSGKEAYIAVRKRADLVSLMRSIWQKMMQPAFFMPHWIIGG